jgi:hypothetical protein
MIQPTANNSLKTYFGPYVFWFCPPAASTTILNENSQVPTGQALCLLILVAIAVLSVMAPTLTCFLAFLAVVFSVFFGLFIVGPCVILDIHRQTTLPATGKRWMLG